MNETLFLPEGYQPKLDVAETERAIRLVKSFFQTNLAFELNLIRVTAPLFVEAGTGINDDLNGVERPVSFEVQALGGLRAEIVQSLAKWKRMALADLGLKPGAGIYTDMNAIRPDETLDNLHSLYVDQWDWERVITEEERTLAFLERIVRRIYSVISRTESYICHHYPQIEAMLPEEIAFVHSEDLEAEFPALTPREREAEVCRRHGAVFVIGIGADLKSGAPHDGRAPDYDDWITPTGGGHRGLNGDILVDYPLLETTLELSSMGVRVDARSLREQLRIRKAEERESLLFHRRLLAGELPLSMGGGIGQSRLCMLFLRKAHIGEIQASLWSDEVRRACRSGNIFLL